MRVAVVIDVDGVFEGRVFRLEQGRGREGGRGEWVEMGVIGRGEGCAALSSALNRTLLLATRASSSSYRPMASPASACCVLVSSFSWW